MIKVNRSILQPTQRSLECDPETSVTIKHATLGDEGKRYEALFQGRESAYLTEIAAVELWLTLGECNVLDENDQPLFKPGMALPEFMEAATLLLNEAPEAFWEMHAIVREINPQWAPASEESTEEGNA
jgi:hypothetical protein